MPPSKIKPKNKIKTGRKRSKVANPGVKGKPPATTGIDFDNDQIKEMLPTPMAKAFVASRMHDASIAKSGLAAPEDWEGKMPELPDDVANTDHDELSQLLIDFQSAYSTAVWHASMNYIDADVYSEIADYLEANAILSSTQTTDVKRKTAAKLDKNVVFFRAQAKVYSHNYYRFNKLAETLKGKVAVISRVGGFKNDEEGLPSRPQAAQSGRRKSK